MHIVLLLFHVNHSCYELVLELEFGLYHLLLASSLGHSQHFQLRTQEKQEGVVSKVHVCAMLKKLGVAWGQGYYLDD